MTSTAMLLAAALGMGQLFPDQPALGSPPQSAAAPSSNETADQFRVRISDRGLPAAPRCQDKEAHCTNGKCEGGCGKDCACPDGCPGKSADVDYSFILDTLDVISDAADFLSDVVAAMWPGPEVVWHYPCTGGYLEHPPTYFAPSPEFPLTNEVAKQQTMVATPQQAAVTMPYPRILNAAPCVPALCPGYVPAGAYPVVAYQQAPVGMAVTVVASPQPVSYAPVAVPPSPAPMAKTVVKLMQSGEHHVLSFTHGESTIVSKKTMITVGRQDLMFTAGASRVHVHGRAFDASADTVTTLTDNTVLLEGDVHFNGDDHGKSMFYKGDKATVVVGVDDFNLIIDKH